MKPIQGSEGLVLSDIAAFGLPVFRVLDQITDRQPQIALNRGEHPDHPAPPPDLHVQPFLPVGRGDPLLINLGEVVEREGVIETLFQAANRLGEPLLVVVYKGRSRPPGALFIRFEPDLLQMSREVALLPMRHVGQDVAHEMDLAALPGGAQPLLPDRSLDARVGVGDVFDAHGLGETFDLPGRDSVDEGFLDDRHQRLLRAPSLRDEERDISALANLGHDKIDRPQPGIDPSGSRPREVRRTLPGVLPLGGSDLGFGLDPHHLRHHPLELGQEGLWFRDEL